MYTTQWYVTLRGNTCIWHVMSTCTCTLGSFLIITKTSMVTAVINIFGHTLQTCTWKLKSKLLRYDVRFCTVNSMLEIFTGRLYYSGMFPRVVCACWHAGYKKRFAKWSYYNYVTLCTHNIHSSFYWSSTSKTLYQMDTKQLIIQQWYTIIMCTSIISQNIVKHHPCCKYT